MIEVSAIVPFLTLGLLGALHCAGMCGGFALAVASSGPARAARRRQWLYGLGKAVTYSVVGVALASGSGRFEATFASSRSWLGALAGGMLIVMGLAQWGFPLRWSGAERLAGRSLRALSAALASARALPGWSGSFGTGVVNGLVPCGLSWSAFALAGRSSPGVALLGCFVFGAATLPALMLVGWVSQAARSRVHRYVPFVLGAALIGFGSRLVLRGVSAPDAAACCDVAEAGRAPH